MTTDTTVDDSDSDRWGGGALTAIMGMLHSLVFVPLQLVSPLLRAGPGTWKLYHKIHLWSGYQMQKASGADTLANVRLSNGKEDVRPAKWVEGSDDDKDLTGWRVKGLGEKRYDAAVHGRTTGRMGKADLIHVNEDDLEQGAWTEATMDNAFQLDRERYLFRDATVDMTLVPGANAQPGGQALADGGTAQDDIVVQDVSLSRPGVLEDVLVPVTSRAGYDGQVVSWNQYSTLKNNQSDQDTIRDAKNSAWVAAKLDDVEAADLLKWAIILGIAGAVLLFHAEIGAFIAGLGSGGGGGGVGGAVSGGLGMMNPAKLLGVM